MEFTGGFYKPYPENLYDYGYYDEKEDTLIFLLKNLIKHDIYFSAKYVFNAKNIKFSISLCFEGNGKNYADFVIMNKNEINFISNILLEKSNYYDCIIQNINKENIVNELKKIKNFEKDGFFKFKSIKNSKTNNILFLIKFIKFIYKNNYELEKGINGIFGFEINKEKMFEIAISLEDKEYIIAELNLNDRSSTKHYSQSEIFEQGGININGKLFN